jgi:hypothetical protein
MAIGLTSPVGVGKSGGAAVESGGDQLTKILRLALLPGEDDNPFQELGIPEKFVFAINDSGTAGLIRQTVRRILTKFADRVALRPGTTIQLSQTAEGELQIQFEYIDLETNEPRMFELQQT